MNAQHGRVLSIAYNVSRRLLCPPLSAKRLLYRLFLRLVSCLVFFVLLVRFFHARNAFVFNDDSKRSKRSKIWSASKNRTDDDLSGGSSSSGLFPFLASFFLSFLFTRSPFLVFFLGISSKLEARLTRFPRVQFLRFLPSLEQKTRDQRRRERESGSKGSTKQPVLFVLSSLGRFILAASLKPTCRRFCGRETSKCRIESTLLRIVLSSSSVSANSVLVPALVSNN